MNAFVLKIIALVSMILDHMGVVFPLTFGFEFRILGRLAFPIYAFLIAEGFAYTKNPVKFLVRLFVFAIISEPFFDLAMQQSGLMILYAPGINFFADTNIFYTLFLGGSVIVVSQWAEKYLQKTVEVSSLILHVIIIILPLYAFMWLAEVALTSDYGAFGVLFIFTMYFTRQFKLKAIRLAVMVMLCIWQHSWILGQVRHSGFASFADISWMLLPAMLMAVVLVAFYNGRRGPGLKWFFYISYPVHLAVLVFFANF